MLSLISCGRTCREALRTKKKKKKYYYLGRCKTKKEHRSLQNVVRNDIYYKPTSLFFFFFFFSGVNQIHKFLSLVTWYNSFSFTREGQRTITLRPRVACTVSIYRKTERERLPQWFEKTWFIVQYTSFFFVYVRVPRPRF